MHVYTDLVFHMYICGLLSFAVASCREDNNIFCMIGVQLVNIRINYMCLEDD